jgi:hypothetical protein
LLLVLVFGVRFEERELEKMLPPSFRKRGRRAATLPTKRPTPGSRQVQIERREVTAGRC